MVTVDAYKHVCTGIYIMQIITNTCVHIVLMYSIYRPGFLHHSCLDTRTWMSSEVQKWRFLMPDNYILPTSFHNLCRQLPTCDLFYSWLWSFCSDNSNHVQKKVFHWNTLLVRNLCGLYNLFLTLKYHIAHSRKKDTAFGSMKRRKQIKQLSFVRVCERKGHACIGS